ncbi:hypothetical protein TNCV_3036181 [Trichonephila clavipes]|nr:hypothetical protein TNCV_3036181 [Trichonephila clavipes]
MVLHLAITKKNTCVNKASDYLKLPNTETSLRSRSPRLRGCKRAERTRSRNSSVFRKTLYGINFRRILRSFYHSPDTPRQYLTR